MSMRLFSSLILMLLMGSCLGQGRFITMKDSVKIYLEETGEGQTLLLIPGWTMTHKFFDRQRDYFSQQYQVITYDPRGQGRSEESTYGNTYATHAEDLRQILLTEDLQNVVLIGWSSGCLTIYEYLRQYDLDRINRLVMIDEPPKWVGDTDSEWVYGDFDGYRSSLKGLISGPSEPDGIIDWMLEDDVSSATKKWMKTEMGMTSPHVALSLYIDGLISDYQSELIAATEGVPTLFMVRASWYERVQGWLAKNAPQASIESITSHAMFWERPKVFNAQLTQFLNSD